MTFDEKIKRNSIDDQIEIGQIVEGALKGNFGSLLKCIIAGIISEELEDGRRDTNIPADRTLGRIESLDKLTERLDQCVDIKSQLLVEKLKDNEVKPSGEAPKG